MAAKVSGVVVRGPIRAGYDAILTSDALQFLAELHRNFESTRRSLLAARVERTKELDSGKLPTFLPETEWIRQSDWKAAKVVHDLSDRRVEITGPVDRKMIINALNSGSKVFMADFEDATAPTWDNLISGHINLIDAVNKTISFSDKGKEYKLKSEIATLMVRPRGWHLPEAHILIDGEVMSASLFDFGLYFYHNAVNAVKKGSGPYFYLPKMESHKEARLWNDVFIYAQNRVGLPIGTVRATVLIETILAAFEMDEIIYELRAHSAGLNCGRWDYIFSFIKKFRNHKNIILPDRIQVTMTVPWMANYVRLLIQTCHRRGVHAMGGMAAQIPIPNNQAENAAAFEKVKADKFREVKLGHDGTWVAHPGLIPIAKQVFDQYMPQPNQLNNPGDQKAVAAADLLDLGSGGTITVNGIRNNIAVGLEYIEAWLRGTGCVPLFNLMEDAATAEIARCQIWQWIKNGAKVSDGNTLIDKPFVEKLLSEEVARIRRSVGDEQFRKRPFALAIQLYTHMLFNDKLDDFLTSMAYPHIITLTQAGANSSSKTAHKANL